MEDAQVLEAYELEFSDLMLLSSDKVSSSSPDIERLESMTRTVMENLGPTGPGLIAIRGVSNASRLSRALLPLARKLALRDNEDRKRVLKEHCLGSDVPLKDLDRTVSSFAMQLKYVQGVKITHSEVNRLEISCCNAGQNYPDAVRLREFQDSEFENLGNTFKELGFCMMELGLCLARICDRAIGGQELEQSLLDSCTAKGRLIHYHSTLDNLILKEAATRGRSTKGRTNSKQQSIRNEQSSLTGHGIMAIGNQSSLWQQWHYDYGIFTVLTAPMFMLPSHLQTSANDYSCISCKQDCPSPSGHTYLQIFDPNKNSKLMVKSSAESFIVQVGESADILSKGRLRSTLHSVSRPAKLENLSRETFVVFLQPAWNKIFSLVDYPIEHLTSSGQDFEVRAEEGYNADQEHKKLTQEIHKIVPPLSARLKDGMTFAEFSTETTKQYYGGSGLQVKR